MKTIPERLQGLFWSTPLAKLDLAKHKAYIIHQVLMYGDLDDIRWLFAVYPKNETERVFLNRPQKIYTKEAFNYVKNFVLDLGKKDISTKKYINALS
jgi:hypothetical protein